MTRFPRTSMQSASASAACADAASACAHTAAFRAASVVDAIVMASIFVFAALGNCVLAVLGIQVILLVVLLAGGGRNPSKASLFA